MKKYVFLLLLAFSAALHAAADTLHWSNDTLYVNTTMLCADIKGYNGTTPVEIAITDGKVVGVRALPNRETRSYFRAVKATLLNQWNGQEVARAIEMKVDVVSGATLSSRAIIGNVRAGLTEAQKVLPTEEMPTKSIPLAALTIGSLLLAAVLIAIGWIAKKKKQK